MHPSTLTLLLSTEARQLAVVWPMLPAEDRNNEAWAQLAGITLGRAEPHMNLLRRSGICLDNGTVDDTALAYIGAKTLPRRR